MKAQYKIKKDYFAISITQIQSSRVQGKNMEVDMSVAVSYAQS